MERGEGWKKFLNLAGGVGDDSDGAWVHRNRVAGGNATAQWSGFAS